MGRGQLPHGRALTIKFAPVGSSHLDLIQRPLLVPGKMKHQVLQQTRMPGR